jgi:beta-galactosidase
VGEQRTAEGYETALRLENLCHEEDPSRPVTCGMDQVHSVLDNGFAAALDIPGFNYKVPYYKKAHSVLPQGLLFASESSSTVSSRGVYFFPIEKKGDVMHPDHQSSSYDTEYCSWSNIPDDDLAADEDYPWVIGQFVWSGFDYLGEPSPYDTDAWPSHSSLFGIIDLAYIPKDRYYLYRSIWNSSSPTLHILPHWTWPGREGKTTPVFVYTSYPEVELFVNGKSYGRRRKNNSSEMARFRLMWDDVVYEPGELKAIAYGNDGKKIAEEVIRTAGKPDHLVILPDRKALSANGKDLAFVNVKVVDRDGNLCPSDNRLVKFTVKGEGTFEASANGDPTCLDSFRLPEMHIFSGELTAIVRSSSAKGDMTFTASAKGLGKASVTIHVF